MKVELNGESYLYSHDNVTPLRPLYNGFYLFPLSRAMNSNRQIFDPSEVEIHQYLFTWSKMRCYVIWYLIIGVPSN